MPPKPLAYQNTGIAFLSARPFALLGDDTGLGKSMQMIRASIALGHQRILVLCPAVGKVSWAIQFQEWDAAARPVYMHPADTGGRIPSGPAALIVTVDWLSDKKRSTAFRAALRKAEPFDVAYLDEAHYLKNPSANRTRAIYGYQLNRRNAVLESVEHVWAASATFTPLNASELYPHMRALLPDALTGLFGGAMPSPWEFTQRFCKTMQTDYGMKIVGNNPDTIPQLRDAIRPYFIMRRKQDVMKELPPITTALLGLDVKLTARTAPADAAAIEAMSDDEFLAYIKHQSTQDPAHATKRKEIGEAKVKAAWPWVRDFLNDDPRRKLILFAHHRSVIETLMHEAEQQGIGAVTLHGGTSATANAQSVAAFQSDPAVRLFVGQVRAAGTSITLTAADTVLMLEPDPSPLNNYQAISRAHRIGQKGNVTALFAFAENQPEDRRLASVLRRRAADFEQLFGASIPGSIPNH